MPKLCEHCGIQSRNLHPTNYGCCYIWFLAHTRVKISWRYLWHLHENFFLCFRAESWNFEINVLFRFCVILQLPSYFWLRKFQKLVILIPITRFYQIHQLNTLYITCFLFQITIITMHQTVRNININWL